MPIIRKKENSAHSYLKDTNTRNEFAYVQNARFLFNKTSTVRRKDAIRKSLESVLESLKIKQYPITIP